MTVTPVTPSLLSLEPDVASVAVAEVDDGGEEDGQEDADDHAYGDVLGPHVSFEELGDRAGCDVSCWGW